MPQVKALEKKDCLRGESEEKPLNPDSVLVFESVVRLVSVWRIVGPVETDLRKARRNLSRIAIVEIDVETWYYMVKTESRVVVSYCCFDVGGSKRYKCELFTLWPQSAVVVIECQAVMKRP